MGVSIEQIEGGAELITLTNATGASVTLSSMGARIVAVNVPDRNGVIANVVERNEPTIGDEEIWHIREVGEDEIEFNPPEDSVNPIRAINYRWTADNVLEIYISTERHINASSIRSVFFNLSGQCATSVMNEYLWLNSKCYVIDNRVKYVAAGGPADFTSAKQLKLCGARHGLTHWLIDQWESGVMNEAAVLACHESGRQLSIYTTLPALTVELGDTENSESPHGIAITCESLPKEAAALLSNPSESEVTPIQELVFLDFSTF